MLKIYNMLFYHLDFISLSLSLSHLLALSLSLSLSLSVDVSCVLESESLKNAYFIDVSLSVGSR